MQQNESQGPSNNLMMKTKREKFRVDFRKQNTDLLLNQKRNLSVFSSDIVVENNPIFNEADKILSYASNLFEAIEAQNKAQIAKNLHSLRLITCIAKDPPLEAILNTQIILPIIKMLGNKLKEFAEIHLDSLWLLTNLSCGDLKIAKYLVDNQILFFLKEIMTNFDDIRILDQAIMCCANLASEEEIRDLFFLEEFDYALLKILTNNKEDHSRNLYRNIAFFLSNLSRKNTQFPDRLAPFLSVIAQFLHVEDEETMIESTWVLYNMSEQNYDYMMKFQTMGVISKIIKNLLSSHDKLKWASLRVVSLIARGPDLYTEVLYQNNIYIYISGILDSKIAALRKEALYCVSNLVAEDKEKCLEHFIDTDVFHKILKMLTMDEFITVREGIYVLTNFVFSATPSLVKKFVYKGGLKVLVQMFDKYLDERDQFLLNILTSVDKIMGTEGKDEMEFIKEFVDYGGIQSLGNGKNLMWENLSEKCIEIYDKYIRDKIL